MKLVNAKTDEVIESSLTNQEAVDMLKAKLDSFYKKDFPQAMIEAGEKSPSEAQMFWLHKLALQESKPKQEPKCDISTEGIMKMFEKAKKHIKRPSIVLDFHGDEIKISLAGEASRYKGQIMVASPEFGQAYYGRIDQNGKYFAGRDSDEKVTKFLISFASNPEEVAAEHGRLTGKCCFCNRGLKDERSTSVGYGKTCAENYGLQWGKVLSK